MPHPSYTVTPIGVIRTPYTEKPLTPRQPGVTENPPEGVITLFPGQNFEQALEDLDGFERVWILFWFDQNEGWTPKVLPPRSGTTRRGLFATRSPHRPNAIGLSLCRLLSVSGRTVRVEDPDLLDGTPILDLKPYIPYAEAFPDAAAGWTAEAGDPSFTLSVAPTAAEQLEFLDRHGVALKERVCALLERHPEPHPSRRTKARAGGGYVLGVKSWRVRYRIEGSAVAIDAVASGYAPAALSAAGAGSLHDDAAHRAFHARWPHHHESTTGDL
jgi:tRNA-Thr(GGU) m(6)t(6)A37 methyltransferase TsaA